MKLEHIIKFVSDAHPGADTDLIKKIVHEVFKQLNFSLQKLQKMAEDLKAALDRAEQQATENDSVIASAVALFETLSGLIRDTAGSAEKANALADKIDAQGANLAAAIAANTPAAEA
jgi:ABC-type transporter Mla subunit MlaD